MPGEEGVRKREADLCKINKQTSPHAKKKTLMNSARVNCSNDALAVRTIRSAPSVHSFKFKAMNQYDAPPARAMMTHRRNSTGISKSTLTRQNRRTIQFNISLFAAACCGCNPAAAAASTVFFSLWIAAAAVQTAATVSACSQPNSYDPPKQLRSRTIIAKCAAIHEHADITSFSSCNLAPHLSRQWAKWFVLVTGARF
jgi:hypothetical protein